jgi:hypothetical protein
MGGITAIAVVKRFPGIGIGHLDVNFTFYASGDNACQGIFPPLAGSRSVPTNGGKTSTHSSPHT